ncbi:NAD(P)-dependent oxidoreductase [Actinokineospora fastidiosa]|uniref:NAD(P)-dependent oxidoreductase n=1 Tax=Actinokineospora fastidiosa TaxID=1816 RepID=UPI001670C9F0|nr:NAD(P)-binding domain-containing protein [Actinokineospora fastidiosa]
MTSGTRVAVIGTGAIGTAVARRLAGSGREVVVWNRTPERAVGTGARVAGSLAEAVEGGDLVLLTLKDHAAVRDCLARLPDLTGRTVVALTTGTAEDARAAERTVTAAGGSYLDAGVQTPPEAIGTDAATFLYSGPRAVFERHASTLALLGTPRFVGERADAAAVWDLALFGVWYDAQLGLLRALDGVRRAGIDVAAFAETAAPQIGHVVTGATATATELTCGEYPAGPADLTEHLTVIRHLIDLRRTGPLGDGGLHAVADRVESLIAGGRGGEGLTATVDG